MHHFLVAWNLSIAQCAKAVLSDDNSVTTLPRIELGLTAVYSSSKVVPDPGTTVVQQMICLVMVMQQPRQVLVPQKYTHAYCIMSQAALETQLGTHNSMYSIYIC